MAGQEKGGFAILTLKLVEDSISAFREMVRGEFERNRFLVTRTAHDSAAIIGRALTAEQQREEQRRANAHYATARSLSVGSSAAAPSKRATMVVMLSSPPASLAPDR